MLFCILRFCCCCCFLEKKIIASVAFFYSALRASELQAEKRSRACGKPRHFARAAAVFPTTTATCIVVLKLFNTQTENSSPVVGKTRVSWRTLPTGNRDEDDWRAAAPFNNNSKQTWGKSVCENCCNRSDVFFWVGSSAPLSIEYYLDLFKRNNKIKFVLVRATISAICLTDNSSKIHA